MTARAVSLRGQGNAGKNGGPAGDLIVGVHIQPHPQFQRDGTTVLYEQPISFYQAAMGAELEIPTIDGKVKYNLPAGTQTGHHLPAERKGHPGASGPRAGRSVRHRPGGGAYWVEWRAEGGPEGFRRRYGGDPCTGGGRGAQGLL